MTIAVGVQAPVFTLESVQGSYLNLAAYRGKSNVLLWFSRGFTCPFCRAYMAQLQSSYRDFQASGTEILQISPNLLTKARDYFRTLQLVFPFLCDPEKRLYTTYGLVDRGPIDASKNILTTFGHAAVTGQFMETTRASALDTLNSSFFQRLQHHALTAVEQALFLIDQDGVVRWVKTLGPLENLPDNRTLLTTISTTMGAIKPTVAVPAVPVSMGIGPNATLFSTA